MLHSVIRFLARFNHIWQKLRTLVIILLIIPILSFFEILVTCIGFIYFFNTSFWNLILNAHITIVELGLYFIMRRVPLLPLMHLDEIWLLFLHESRLFGWWFAIQRSCDNIRITLVIVLVSLLLERFRTLIWPQLILPDTFRWFGRIVVLELGICLLIGIFGRLLLADNLWGLHLLGKSLDSFGNLMLVLSKLLDVLLFCIDAVKNLQGYTLLIGTALDWAIKILGNFRTGRRLHLSFVNHVFCVKVIVRVDELRLHVSRLRGLNQRLIKHMDALFNHLIAFNHYLWCHLLKFLEITITLIHKSKNTYKEMERSP